MRKRSLCVLVFLVSLTAWLSVSSAVAAEIADLSFDKSNYQVGEQAEITVTYTRAPEESDYEFHNELIFEDATIATKAESVTVAKAKLPSFTETGEFDVELRVHLQNKFVNDALEESMAYFEAENEKLAEELAHEQDEAARAVIQAEIERNKNIIQDHREEQRDNRRLIEIKFTRLEVIN